MAHIDKANLFYESYDPLFFQTNLGYVKKVFTIFVERAG